jgi:carbon storage regulator
MLVLTRKVDQCIVIGSTIEVRVLDARKGRVKLGFSAPAEVPIQRTEIHPQKDRDTDVRPSCPSQPSDPDR